MRMKITFLLWFLMVSNFIFAVPYAVNFMWINSETNLKNSYVFSPIRAKEVQEKNWDVEVERYLESWIMQNPQADINLWYDLNAVTPQQIKNTEELFAVLTTKAKREKPIFLKNIHELPVVRNHPDVFSKAVPIYLRVDLLRIIAGLDYVNSCSDDMCVYIYVDLDKGMIKPPSEFATTNEAYLPSNMPVSKNELLDPETLKSIEEKGLVMQGSEGRAENNFIMLSNKNKNMMQALQTIVVDSNLLKIRQFSSLGQSILDQAQETIKDIHGKSWQEQLGFIRNKLMSSEPSLATKIRRLEKSQTEAIYNSMVVGPLMLYFEFLNKNISLVFNKKSLIADNSSENAALFSSLLTELVNPDFLSDRENKMLQVLDEPGSEVIKKELWRLIPVKNIFGSPSKAKNFQFSPPEGL